MERPSSSNGFVSVYRILSEKAETHLKKVYDRKCKQRHNEHINNKEDLPVTIEPYGTNLLDRTSYYIADGADNLYNCPKEIAAKLGLEYKGSHIVTVFLSTRKPHASPTDTAASQGSSVGVISKQKTTRVSIASRATVNP